MFVQLLFLNRPDTGKPLRSLQLHRLVSVDMFFRKRSGLQRRAVHGCPPWLQGEECAVFASLRGEYCSGAVNAALRVSWMVASCWGETYWGLHWVQLCSSLPPCSACWWAHPLLPSHQRVAIKVQRYQYSLCKMVSNVVVDYNIAVIQMQRRMERCV